MNREELIEAYVDRVVDSMSTRDLERYVFDVMSDALRTDYDEEDMRTLISETYPDLLENEND